MMTGCDLAAVVVHYRTPDRIAPTSEALHRQAREAGCTLRVVVVDQSGDAPDPDPTGAIGWCTLRPLDNLGYAGGFNAAVRQVPDAAYYLLLNPDVELEEGALSRLMSHALPRGAVGPMLFWDADFRLLQPPTREPETPRWLSMLHGPLPNAAASWHRRRWRARARRHWRARDPLPTRHLSGACLLIGRAALDLVGPMDERFRLYYEETDWLRRLWTAGGRSLLVPSARGVHEFDASASQEDRREEWFAHSESLYRDRYGVGTDLPAHEEELPAWPASLAIGRRRVWLELSPFSSGVPAAAERLDLGSGGRLTWTPPPELAARVSGFSLTVVDERGRELGRYQLASSD